MFFTLFVEFGIYLIEDKFTDGLNIGAQREDLGSCRHYGVCGDIDGDELQAINIFDIVYLIEFLYLDGPPPVNMNDANVNGDEDINIFDIVYLIDFLYQGGPEPDCP